MQVKTLFYMGLLLSQLWAQEIHLSVRLLPSSNSDTLRLAVAIPDGYHVTSDRPLSEDLVPLTTELQAPGIHFGPAQYPAPTLEAKEGLDYKLSYFIKNLFIKVPILSVDSKLQHGSALKVSLYFQACTDKNCYAPHADETLIPSQLLQAALGGSRSNKITKSPSSASIEIPSSSSSSPSSSAQQLSSEHQTKGAGTRLDPIKPQANENGAQLWLKFLILAFFGGMILNLMPCVLPVLGLKVFSLVEKKGRSRAYLYANSGSFLAGTLFSFWILAILMISLKNLGTNVGWGFQFQEPGFVIFMAVLVTLFSLNLFGLFEVSLGWKAQTKMNQAGSKEGLAGAFFNGTFMTLLATPCTAPMLSPAMGFAFSQPDYVLVLFMTVVALGLATPYLAFSLIPGALKFFPKPGNWMIVLKEFMGFLLLFTLPWLLYVFSAQTGGYAVAVLVALLAVLALFVWAYHKLPWTGSFAEHFWPKPLTILILTGIWVFGGYYSFLKPAVDQDRLQGSQRQNDDRWTPSKVIELNALGKDVFVDFSAAWCVSCKANEKLTLENQSIKTYFAHGRPIKLIADNTKANPEILAELKRFGRSGVPMYVLYRANGTSHVFPEVITPEILTEEFDRK